MWLWPCGSCAPLIERFSMPSLDCFPSEFVCRWSFLDMSVDDVDWPTITRLSSRTVASVGDMVIHCTCHNLYPPACINHPQFCSVFVNLYRVIRPVTYSCPVFDLKFSVKTNREQKYNFSVLGDQNRVKSSPLSKTRFWSPRTGKLHFCSFSQRI